MLLIHKHSYKAKDEIKKLGGKWNPDKKGWIMPSQHAYDEALLFCDAFNKVEHPDADEHEDVIGHTKWGLTNEQKNSVAWMFPKSDQIKLDKNPIASKDNIDKKVVAGLTFTGRGKDPHETWCVTAFKEDWELLSDEKNSFCCITLSNMRANFLTEEQIRQHIWKNKLDIENVKQLYRQFMEQ
jgi:hypothetical protein